MQKFIRFGALCAALIMCAGAASAGILDIRGGVGLSAANKDDFENQAKSVGNGGIDANDFTTYNADIFINLPGIPLGFGVRHEWLNLNSGSGGNHLDLKATNLSALVDLRLIDTNHFYIGPIVSVGHPSAKVNFKTGAISIDKHIPGNSVSYGAGLEAGVYIGHFLIGAEGGYQNVKFKDADDGAGHTASFDASGVYGKGMIGLTFF